MSYIPISQVFQTVKSTIAELTSTIINLRTGQTVEIHTTITSNMTGPHKVYVTPWSVVRDDKGGYWIAGDMSVSLKPGGAVSLLVTLIDPTHGEIIEWDYAHNLPHYSEVYEPRPDWVQIKLV